MGGMGSVQQANPSLYLANTTSILEKVFFLIRKEDLYFLSLGFLTPPAQFWTIAVNKRSRFLTKQPKVP